MANHGHPEYPELEDYGEAALVGGQRGDQLFPRRLVYAGPGLRTWGDGRTFILGTKGYIELRKYIDVARRKEGDHLYLVNAEASSTWN